MEMFFPTIVMLLGTSFALVAAIYVLSPQYAKRLAMWLLKPVAAIFCAMTMIQLLALSFHHLFQPSGLLVLVGIVLISIAAYLIREARRGNREGFDQRGVERTPVNMPEFGGG